MSLNPPAMRASGSMNWVKTKTTTIAPAWERISAPKPTPTTAHKPIAMTERKNIIRVPPSARPVDIP